jgi:hypothetical protein
MGRGRAKAKQTKVARDLKYRTHETDFGALANELHGGESERSATSDQAQTQDDSEDDPGDGSGDTEDDADQYGSWSGYSDSRLD